MNGKALLNGVRLPELDAADMLDIVHYFFEEDLLNSSVEMAEAKSSMRSRMYQDMYETTYKYPVKSSGESYNYSTASGESEMPSEGFVDDELQAFDPDRPDKGPTKPFVPATEFDPDNPNPFGQLLDPPSGM